MSQRNQHPRESNAARVVAWAKQQISQQNEQLHEALTDAPDYAHVLASVCQPTVNAQRPALPFINVSRA